jgi:hypothetical protein
MTDVVIRKLELNVVRRGSLFWGEDPRALSRRVMGVLGPMLEARFQRLDQPDLELELAEPVRCTVQLKSPHALAAGFASEQEWTAIRARLDQALAPALDRAVERSRERDGRPTLTPSPPKARAPGALARLMPLHLVGQLVPHLERLRGPALEELHDELWVSPPPAPPREPGPADVTALERWLLALSAELSVPTGRLTRQAQQRRRIIAAIRAAAELGIVPFSSAARRLVDRVFPLDPSLEDEPAFEKATGRPGSVPGADGPPQGGTREVDAPDVAATGLDQSGKTTGTGARSKQEPIDVPLLPLLVAATLDRVGTFALLARVLTARQQPLDLPLVVAAIALKLGPIPRRGWLHEPRTLAQVAGVAGIAVLSPDALTHLADDSRVEWASLQHELPGVRPGVTVADEPAREELSLSRAPDDTPPLGSDPVVTVDSELTAALNVRPAAPLARRPDFERVLEQLVFWTMTELGNALWPGEPSAGFKVLERFASLDCHFGRNSDGYRALVPLGPRRTDLARVGALVDLPRASWLSAPLTFRGG